DDIWVNVMADLSSHTGMNTTARQYIRALKSIGARLTTIDSSGGTQPEGGDCRVTARQHQKEINLICCEVASHFDLRARYGEALFRGRYTVGVWLWELSEFPKQWCDRFAYYDEIWAPTSFIASVVSRVSPLPVVHMPFILEPRHPGSRPTGRERLGIP